MNRNKLPQPGQQALVSQLCPTEWTWCHLCPPASAHLLWKLPTNLSLRTTSYPAPGPTAPCRPSPVHAGYVTRLVWSQGQSPGSLQREDKNARPFPLRFQAGYTLPQRLPEANSQTRDKSLQKEKHPKPRNRLSSPHRALNQACLPNPTLELQLREPRKSFFPFKPVWIRIPCHMKHRGTEIHSGTGITRATTPELRDMFW